MANSHFIKVKGERFTVNVPSLSIATPGPATATVLSGCFSTYTVSTLTSVRSFFSRRSLLRETRVRSVTCTSLRVSPWSFCRRVMVVTSRRVSWTATATCCQTVSLVTASVRSSRSLLLALRLTLQLVKHRTVRAMRAVADALYRIPQPGYFLPQFVHLALQGLTSSSSSLQGITQASLALHLLRSSVQRCRCATPTRNPYSCSEPPANPFRRPLPAGPNCHTLLLVSLHYYFVILIFWNSFTSGHIFIASGRIPNTSIIFFITSISLLFGNIRNPI